MRKEAVCTNPPFVHQRWSSISRLTSIGLGLDSAPLPASRGPPNTQGGQPLSPAFRQSSMRGPVSSRGGASPRAFKQLNVSVPAGVHRQSSGARTPSAGSPRYSRTHPAQPTVGNQWSAVCDCAVQLVCVVQLVCNPTWSSPALNPPSITCRLHLLVITTAETERRPREIVENNWEKRPREIVDRQWLKRVESEPRLIVSRGRLWGSSCTPDLELTTHQAAANCTQAACRWLVQCAARFQIFPETAS